MKKLVEVKEKATLVRERLVGTAGTDQKQLARLDRTIRGAAIVQWLNLFAVIFFILFSAVFSYLQYPYLKGIGLILGCSVAGYAICYVGILIQIKLYERTIANAEADMQATTSA